MPYTKFTTYISGRKKYALKSLKSGKVLHFNSAAARDKAVRMREAFAHGWKPTGLAHASAATRHRVSSLGGRTRRRK